MDPRVDKLATLLASYSLEVKPGDRVLLHGDVATLPLLRAFYGQIVQTWRAPGTDGRGPALLRGAFAARIGRAAAHALPILPPGGGDGAGLPHRLGEQEHAIPEQHRPGTHAIGAPGPGVGGAVDVGAGAAQGDPLVRHPIPHRGGRAGGEHVPGRVRGLLLLGLPAGPGGPGERSGARRSRSRTRSAPGWSASATYASWPRTPTSGCRSQADRGSAAPAR